MTLYVVVFFSSRKMQFVIIGIEINQYFADTEQRTGCERSAQRLMGSMFVKRNR